MILVKIELHSAVTGKITEIGRMKIVNIGGTTTRGNYLAHIMRRGTLTKPSKTVNIENYPRLSYSVWELVRRVLESGAKTPRQVPVEPSDDLAEEDS
jgi:hypothetical protein